MTSHCRAALAAAGLPPLTFDGPCCMIRRALVPAGHKRCAICLDVQPLTTFGAHVSYCKACRREAYHARYAPQRKAAA